MADERVTVTLSELARWLVAAVLIVAGLAFFLRLAPETRAVTAEVTER